MRILILLSTAVCSWAQSGIQSPFLGQMIDPQGMLRPVYGLSGNFVLGAPLLAARVFSSACSPSLCLAKTESAIISSVGVTPAPAGGAIFAMDAAGATIYFPLTRQFARWQNGTLTNLDLQVDGTLLSLATTSTGLLAAVERSGTVWIVAASTGAIEDSLPAGSNAVLLLPSLTVYATADALVLRKSDGSELSFPAPGVTTLIALGNGYVEAIAPGVLYALRTVERREQLFRLPEPKR